MAARPVAAVVTEPSDALGAGTAHGPFPPPDVSSAIPRLFNRRAALYHSLDRRLASQTRFFGAAAIVNAALAELHTRPWGRWCAGAAASGLLLQVGGRLERLNLGIAARLATHARHGLRALRGTGLDEAIVTVEQLEVERLLRQMHAADAGAHRRALVRIDRLLRWATRAARRGRGPWPSASASVCLALRAVGTQLGRAASFRFYEDRQRIGQALICQLRRGGARAG